jgi:hypothetical protein
MHTEFAGFPPEFSDEKSDASAVGDCANDWETQQRLFTQQNLSADSADPPD